MYDVFIVRKLCACVKLQGWLRLARGTLLPKAFLRKTSLRVTLDFCRLHRPEFFSAVAYVIDENKLA